MRHFDVFGAIKGRIERTTRYLFTQQGKFKECPLDVVKTPKYGLTFDAGLQWFTQQEEMCIKIHDFSDEMS